MSPIERLAVWLYERPRLRRAWRMCCALWCGAAWAVIAAPIAAAAPYQPSGPTVPSIASGQFLMAWTGLHDSYGVPVSDYFISTVSSLQASVYAFDQEHCGITQLGGCLEGGLAGFTAALSNLLGSGILALECAMLIFIGAGGIWFIKFALSAPWLSWLASLATPFVNSLNVMVDQLYVIPIALLVCCGFGGVIALTKGVGRGLGIIAGGFLVILLIYLLLRDPVSDMLGPNGVIGIGQYLGFVVAEGAVHNGPLASGGSGASLDALTSLLCDALLREPIQVINFNTVIDNNPACAGGWSAAIMTGQISAPANAMTSCGDPAALAYADQLGLGTAGWFLVVILVEFVVMLALVYIGFHVIAIGFKAFANVLVLVAAAPLAVAPGPPRRFGRRIGHKVIIDGVEMFATTTGLGVEAIILAEVTSGSVPGMTGMSSPLAKLMMMLLLAVFGAYAYHHMLVSFRHGHGLFGRVAKFGEDLYHLDYLEVTATNYSLSGLLRRRMYPDPTTSQLWPGPNSNYTPKDDRPQPVYIVESPPGRAAHPTPGGGPDGPGGSGGPDGPGGGSGGDGRSGTSGRGGPSGSSSPSGGVGRAFGAAAAAAAPEVAIPAEAGEAAAGAAAAGVGRTGSGRPSQGPGPEPPAPRPLGPGEPGWARPGDPPPLAPGR